jgi:hypothetical protein
MTTPLLQRRWWSQRRVAGRLLDKRSRAQRAKEAETRTERQIDTGRQTIEVGSACWYHTQHVDAAHALGGGGRRSAWAGGAPAGVGRSPVAKSLTSTSPVAADGGPCTPCTSMHGDSTAMAQAAQAAQTHTAAVAARLTEGGAPGGGPLGPGGGPPGRAPDGRPGGPPGVAPGGGPGGGPDGRTGTCHNNEMRSVSAATRPTTQRRHSTAHRRGRGLQLQREGATSPLLAAVHAVALLER